MYIFLLLVNTDYADITDFFELFPADLFMLTKTMKTLFESLSTNVLKLCYRYESGRKYTSTIFLPTSEPIL